MSQVHSREWIARSPGELDSIAEEVVKFLKSAPPVWLLDGSMGAGKTTFASALGRVLAIEDMVQSPTFGLVNEYTGQAGEVVYHFDFYRLKNVEEALAIGVEEYLYSGRLCWLEWAEKVAPLLPDQCVTIAISVETDYSRKIVINYYE